MMTQTTRVLLYVENDGGAVWFSNEEGDEREHQPTKVQIPEADWTEMREPSHITVTIVPGDTLNDPNDPMAIAESVTSRVTGRR